jgi:hypothetical protein
MDGWRDIPHVLRKSGGPEKEFNEELVGWHCWAYCDDHHGFEEWMKNNMTGAYDCTWRFNSGDPMHTVLITKPEDATLFKLTWNPNPDRFGGAGAW